MKNLFAFAFVAVLVFASCSKDEEETHKTENVDIEIKVGEEYEFENGTYLVEEEPYDFVATISDGGVIKGEHEGYTNYSISAGKKTYKGIIKVSAKTTLYVDMKVFLGKQRSLYEALYGSPKKTESLSNGEKRYYYKPRILENESYITCDSEGILTSAVILFHYSYSEYLIEHISDRYSYIGKGSEFYMFMDSYSQDNATTIVGVTVGGLDVAAVYIPNPSSDLKSGSDQEIHLKIKDALKH